MRSTFVIQAGLIFSVIAVWPLPANATEEPIARIAVISNPYLTTIPPDQIKDESGRVRDFLAKTAPTSMEKTVSLVNSIRPDALIVLGSLSWTGSEDDLNAVAGYLSRIETPIFVVPGHRDRLSGSSDVYQRIIGRFDVTNGLCSVNGVQLAFASDLHTNPDAASERLESQFAEAEESLGVLLFTELDRTMGRSRLTTSHKRFWKVVEKHHIAARFEPTRYGHQLGYENTLPIWTVGSTGWSTRGAITLIHVFADHIEMTEVLDPTQLTFSLTIPNPVIAPRMASAAEDPFACPSFTEDIECRPDFTFALVSDPQFDREVNREYLIRKADAAISELNRLDPAMVFVAGDLVNNNLPEEWELFIQMFEKLKPPKHVVPGNHDVLFNYNFIEQSYLSAPTKKPEYAEIVKRALAEAAQQGYSGSTALFEKYTGTPPRQMIEHGDCVFITVPFLTTRADSGQIEFLKEQLKQAETRKHVFVVAHYPALPAFGNNLQPQLGGTEVLSLLQEHRVTGYLFGHRHRNGFRMHESTAHVLTDNMLTIHLLHVFPDRVILARKKVGTPLYEKLTIQSPRG